MSYHCYADDTQLYIDFNSIDCNDISNKLESCLSEIVHWMQLNRLKLNRDKTELVLFSPRGRPDFSPNFNLEISSYEVFPVSVVKNLGVFFDKNLSMESQINSICKSFYFQIRNIGKIRRFISDVACKTLIHSLVISKLDYCNALLYGLPDKRIDRLQRVQNCAARVISRTRRNEHISPVLIDLHWLPVKQRSMFKILLYTFKALNCLAPVYLSDLLKLYQPNRSLRSEQKSLLTKPITRTKLYGNAF